MNKIAINYVLFTLLLDFNCLTSEINANFSQFNSSDKKVTKSSSTLQRRVCYFANWGPYRNIKPPLYPNNIDPSLCTHIHYAFAKIDPTTLNLQGTEEYDMNWTEKSNMPLYIRLYSLKRKNPTLKILLAVGGWSAKSTGFNFATRTASNRSKFINQTLIFLRLWNFDGIDLDWEFPGDKERGADSDSKYNFNALVTELRLAVNEEASISGKRRLLISSAVTPDPKKIENGYVVSNLCNQLDYISVMTYDYGGFWDDLTGLNSPLYSRYDDGSLNESNSMEKWKNVNYSINYWISNGCSPEKINLGLAAYGRSFTLRNSSLNKVGSPSIKGGEAGVYTREEGIYSYFEVCEKLNVDNWQKKWDNKQQSVYATREDQWVGFDNERSISLKVKWAASMLLGGTMLWTLDFDDYSGQFCNDGPFPLANAIKAIFDEYSQSEASTNDSFISNNTNSLMIEFDKQYTSTIIDLISSTPLLSLTTLEDKSSLINKESNKYLSTYKFHNHFKTNETISVLNENRNNSSNLSQIQISVKEKNNSFKNSAHLKDFNLFYYIFICKLVVNLFI